MAGRSVVEQAQVRVHALLWFDGANWRRFERDNLAGVDPSTLAVLPLPARRLAPLAGQSEGDYQALERERDEAVRKLDFARQSIANLESALQGSEADLMKATAERDFWRERFEGARADEAAALRERDEARADTAQAAGRQGPGASASFAGEGEGTITSEPDVDR